MQYLFGKGLMGRDEESGAITVTISQYEGRGREGGRGKGEGGRGERGEGRGDRGEGRGKGKGEGGRGKGEEGEDTSMNDVLQYGPSLSVVWLSPTASSLHLSCICF